MGRTVRSPARSRVLVSSIFDIPSIRRARGEVWGHSNGPGWMRTYCRASLQFDFAGLYGSDLVGRASAFKRMVEGGMAVSEAVALAGLVAADE